MTDPGKKTQPLSVLSKLSYGFGGVGTEIIFTVLGAYSSLFLVQVAQMPPLFATSIIFGSRVVDVFCNFILGPLIDRTNTRWGKTKPWIVVSGLFMIVANLLIFYVPDVGTEGKLAWYIVMYSLMMLAMSGFAISYRTLVMFMSNESAERDSVILYRAVLGLGGVVGGVAMHGQILASYKRSEYDPCANNTNSSVDGSSLEMTKAGYMISAATVCCLYLLCLLAMVLGTTERKDISSTSGGQHDQPVLKTVKTVLTFRPNVYFLLAYFFIQVPLSIGHGTMALYVQYSLDLKDQIENLILAFMASSALSMPVIALVVSKFGKRFSFICFQLAAIPLYLGFQFLPSGNMAVFAVAIGCGFTTSTQYFIPWAIISDIIEDCYLRTKERLDTTFVAVLLSTNSLGITIGLIAATIGLKIGGYQMGSCTQPDSVGSTLRILLSAFPSVMTFIAVIFLWMYPITEERQKEIDNAVRERCCLLGKEVELKTYDR